ncbi:DUF2291 family protein [Flectobacillus roseus]|uniref:DUF2291 family protein n=1 Tax=Flectobacillus roseus TaxID=502259 RepID=A0ABT6YEW4_9BACT|nr:DUF2291 family protein [Flectobacillus roseus]MDI9861972.1 DUF2291 family protein [Flectobacillus roseus]
MKKIIISSVLAVVAIYNSIYIESLDDLKQKKESNFDFAKYSQDLYQQILSKSQAVELSQLLSSFAAKDHASVVKYGNRLGIGSSAYYLVKCQAKILEVQGDRLKVLASGNRPLEIDTKFIFGNAIRDASGLVKLTDFKTTAEFNKISESLNTIIREKAIPDEIKTVKVGDTIDLVGAVKLGEKQEDLLNLSVLPIKISKI